MKASFVSVVVAAGLCLAGVGSANAADTQASAASPGAHSHQFASRDPVARAQGRLDHLNKKLNLTAAQQPAWASFSSAMLKLAQERAQATEKWKSADHSKRRDMSTPDRLEKMADRMRTGAERLSRLASGTKTFYAELSPEQKTIFDLYAATGWRRHMPMMQRMHH